MKDFFLGNTIKYDLLAEWENVWMYVFKNLKGEVLERKMTNIFEPRYNSINTKYNLGIKSLVLLLL